MRLRADDRGVGHVQFFARPPRTTHGGRAVRIGRTTPGSDLRPEAARNPRGIKEQRAPASRADAPRDEVARGRPATSGAGWIVSCGVSSVVRGELCRAVRVLSCGVDRVVRRELCRAEWIVSCGVNGVVRGELCRAVRVLSCGVDRVVRRELCRAEWIVSCGVNGVVRSELCRARWIVSCGVTSVVGLTGGARTTSVSSPHDKRQLTARQPSAHRTTIVSSPHDHRQAYRTTTVSSPHDDRQLTARRAPAHRTTTVRHTAQRCRV